MIFIVCQHRGRRGNGQARSSWLAHNKPNLTGGPDVFGKSMPVYRLVHNKDGTTVKEETWSILAHLIKALKLAIRACLEVDQPWRGCPDPARRVYRRKQ
jgi:hypothetical protein